MIWVTECLLLKEGVMDVGGQGGVTTKPAWAHDSFVNLFKRYY